MTEIFQLNQKKSFMCAVELNKVVTKVKEYICLISEPFKVKCRIASRPDQSKVLVVKSLTPPRAAIYYKCRHEIIMLDFLSNEDCVVGLLNNGDEKILLVSAYLDITKAAVPDWLAPICKYADDNNFPTLMGVDSNAHSVLFGEETNKRGEKFEEFILKHGLMVENEASRNG